MKMEVEGDGAVLTMPLNARTVLWGKEKGEQVILSMAESNRDDIVAKHQLVQCRRGRKIQEQNSG